MALSTVKIADTVEWSKRLSFDRNPVIGNSLEPALTNANIVMQTILGPPFSWWWNNGELTFTCSSTPKTASLTNISIVSGVLTVTAPNSFFFGSTVIFSAVNIATQLNGLLVVVQSATSSSFTANVTLPDYASAANTGTVTATSTQDYVVPAANFSTIEYASLLDIDQASPKWIEIGVKNTLSLDSITDRPRFISPNTEDGNGNMTFRVMPAPINNYPISIQIQNAAPRITSINDTWAPIPDYLQYVYNWGFLALQWQFSDDPRSAIANQKFLAGLLGRAEGINEEERNIFLNNWRLLSGMDQAEMSQGVQARGV